ncbi:MAG: type II toxin-antitoxin system RelE/ParE family toxin [Candidatus Pacebacteria bacterium]|nr:type II toxin-antitoxin system RelE/ParE family toxin [Candidatus Paceibacterota bacterium]
MGKDVPDFPGLKYLVIKWCPRGYGHAVYYEIHESAIRIIRVLHTAMNASDHLKEP